jgi:hypothetical protein
MLEHWSWIEALHQAVMETDNLKDFDGLSLWWRDAIANPQPDEKGITK